MPARIFISVLLPAPFSPIKACTSPAQTRRSTPFKARTPGKLLVIWRTSRMGPGALLCPAFVLVDIFFSDQFHRDQRQRLIRLFTVQNVVTYINGFAGHGKRILCRAGRNQTLLIL